jgi:nitroimidazol reductase NimA-like FMN-containing flavoprotein (pyridoxamine 5'-phosphate oxidase superfamily)
VVENETGQVQAIACDEPSRYEKVGVLIEEINEHASFDLLAQARLGRLACIQEFRAYIVPFHFAYRPNYLYSFSAVGQKIEWMRANPIVYLEVDDVISPHKWKSVIVFGQYEELPDAPAWQLDCEFALKVLQEYPMWWESWLRKNHPQRLLPELHCSSYRSLRHSRSGVASGHRPVGGRCGRGKAAKNFAAGSR